MKPKQLTAVRKQMGKSRRELAAMLDASVDAVSSWESGRRPISKITDLAIQHLNCILQTSALESNHGQGTHLRKRH
jgi:DNA-binding transcriptional regulator YiaG